MKAVRLSRRLDITIHSLGEAFSPFQIRGQATALGRQSVHALAKRWIYGRYEPFERGRDRKELLLVVHATLRAAFTVYAEFLLAAVESAVERLLDPALITFTVADEGEHC